eukprot:3745272-Rhodomonas_salina.1
MHKETLPNWKNDVGSKVGLSFLNVEVGGAEAEFLRLRKFYGETSPTDAKRRASAASEAPPRSTVQKGAGGAPWQPEQSYQVAGSRAQAQDARSARFWRSCSGILERDHLSLWQLAQPRSKHRSGARRAK